MKKAYLIVDWETGGLDPLTHSGLEIGLLLYIEGLTAFEYETRVTEDDIVIDRYNLTDGKTAFDVNGLRPLVLNASGEFELCPEWGGKAPLQVCREINAWLQECTAAAGGDLEIISSSHNTTFDTAYTRRLYSLAAGQAAAAPRLPRVLSGYHSLCTWGLAWFANQVGLIDLPGSGRLDDCLVALGIPKPADRHSAIGDCRIQLAVLLGLLERVSTLKKLAPSRTESPLLGDLLSNPSHEDFIQVLDDMAATNQ